MPDRAFVLDASALLALVNAEPGAAEVAGYTPHAAISSVNWCEVYGKLRAVGVDGDALVREVAETGLAVVPFDDADARAAGELLLSTRDAGLSLADRACLALSGSACPQSPPTAPGTTSTSTSR